ncbi:hypothetical protein KKC94_01490 [Patescibacteria group bacterium]|nr:hypothetical protein [Patescibacteria group bacterium]
MRKPFISPKSAGLLALGSISACNIELDLTHEDTDTREELIPLSATATVIVEPSNFVADRSWEDIREEVREKFSEAYNGFWNMKKEETEVVSCIRTSGVHEETLLSIKAGEAFFEGNWPNDELHDKISKDQEENINVFFAVSNPYDQAAVKEGTFQSVVNAKWIRDIDGSTIQNIVSLQTSMEITVFAPLSFHLPPGVNGGESVVLLFECQSGPGCPKELCKLPIQIKK